MMGIDCCRIAQDIFWRLHENGCIIKDNIEQLLCTKCDRFVAVERSTNNSACVVSQCLLFFKVFNHCLLLFFVLV